MRQSDDRGRESDYDEIADEPLYVISDDDKEAEVKDRTSTGAPVTEGKSPFMLMLDLLANTVEGWKKIRRRKLKIQDVLAKLLFPMVGILALSRFAMLFYDENASLSATVVSAVVSFISFFFGYYTIVAGAGLLLGKDCNAWTGTNFGKSYVAYSLSTLVLFSIISSLLPMLEPIIVFMPLWTIYVVCRGVRFLKVPEDLSTRVSIVMSILVVGVPLAYGWLFGKILSA